VIGVMYFRPSQAADRWRPRDLGPILAMGLCVAIVIGVGVWPGHFLDLAHRGGKSLSQPLAEPTGARHSGPMESVKVGVVGGAAAQPLTNGAG